MGPSMVRESTDRPPQAGSEGSGAPSGAEDVAAQRTIDELAREVGMSVRNLREWRSLGLLPAPTMVGRSGRYGDDVVERIRAIQRLHDDGFPLELIRRLLDANSDLSDDIVTLAALARTPLRRANVGDENALRMFRVGEALSRMGLSSDDMLAVTNDVRGELGAVAARFEEVWMERVWEPFVAAGMPEGERLRIGGLLAELPDRAVDAVVSIFTAVMAERIDTGIAREAHRALGDTGPVV